MPGLTPFQPDDDYCVYCHKPAAGRCAVCHALVCADCAELTTGLSHPIAVCEGCSEKRLQPGREILGWILVPLLVLVGIAALLYWLIG